MGETKKKILVHSGEKHGRGKTTTGKEHPEDHLRDGRTAGSPPPRN